MEVVGYVLLGVVVLWVVQKVVLSRYERSVTDSADAQRIRAALAATGEFDGSDAARARARELFVDLAENGPLRIVMPLDACARDFSQNLSPASGPLLLEAAWTIVGAHRLSFPSDPKDAPRAQKDADLAAAALFSSLFGTWTKEMTQRYRVTSPAALHETQLRMSLATRLMLDLCERRGISPSTGT